MLVAQDLRGLLSCVSKETADWICSHHFENFHTKSPFPHHSIPLVHATSYLRAQPWESRMLAGSRCRRSRCAWLFPSCCGSLSRFSCGFNRRWQFQLGLFRSAMVAMVQRLDARSFFFYPQLSVSKFSVFVLKIFRNRSSCHGRSVAELSSSKLSTFGHMPSFVCFCGRTSRYPKLSAPVNGGDVTGDNSPSHKLRPKRESGDFGILKWALPHFW